MSRLTLSPRARQDLQRLVDFLLSNDPDAAADTVTVIRQALSVLTHQPRIGRPVQGRLRELVIQRGNTGYIALYRVSIDLAEVEVLAIRHQRESGYHPGDL
ncbi:type II toxin-antitoxin system RelE/ParE family toxin [Pseudacidovorax intermedius]|uniref:Plasmid stabilization system protein ParE n=1 Tax=Pseudacidovorax intermedius TaxID=433924 RepID=A0A370FR36_9BURK|nr:type II toxin-antitoxin system RelE/ParE family toxin [Pseudacidovorax intermedius]RDI29321.1 plasmid stabilization system protein ParE [Pseudacidovorax intermedius]